MGINVGNLIINGEPIVTNGEQTDKEIVIVEKPVAQENGTVMVNGKQKRFHKRMSQYMIDMLTTED
jgi:uncharacterized Zn-binding protein involved in type VI secretion